MMIRIVPIILVSILVLNGCQFKHFPDEPIDDGTNNLSVITNGDFEATTDNKTPDNWILNIVGTPSFNFFALDNTIMQSGTKSLKVTYIDSLANPDPQKGSWGGIYQSLPINNLVVGQRYYLKYWVKSVDGNFQVRLLKNGDSEQPILSYIVQPDNKWTEYTMGFQIDNSTNFMWILISTKTSFAKNGKVNGWLDNIRVTSAQ